MSGILRRLGYVAAVAALLFTASFQHAAAQGGPLPAPTPIPIPQTSGHGSGLTPLGVYAIAAPVCAAVSPMIGTLILQREMTTAEVWRSTLGCFLGPVGWMISPLLFPDTVTTVGPTQTARSPQRGNSNNNGRFRAPPRIETRFVPNEVLVVVRTTLRPAARDALFRRLQLTVLETQSFGLTGHAVYRLRIENNATVAQVIRALSRRGMVASAQPNYRYDLAQSTTSADAAPTADALPPGIQYVIDKLRLRDIHKITGGDDIVIAVIDSAIDRAHPDLAGAVVETFDAIGTQGPAHAHGTGMAGAIASHARLTGIAPRARIVAVRAFDDGASAAGTTFAILKGIDWAHGRNAKIVNMSFAGPADPLLAEMLTRANAAGMVLVAAVGNAGPRSPPLYPAAYREVIGVTAVDADDKLFARANRGSQVRLAAPGVDILVPSPGSAYQMTTGTSVAAAYVSGAAALILARRPSASPADVRRLLTTTAARAAGARAEETGAGVLDPLQAVTAADRR
ncbi:MAG: S8 family serine peptidase [Pseudolabrys sp.]